MFENWMNGRYAQSTGDDRVVSADGLGISEDMIADTHRKRIKALTILGTCKPREHHLRSSYTGASEMQAVFRS
jgi:hypothetical protein